MTTPTETRDFVIIGSGFGGSVSALRLSEKGYDVLILERGKRYTAADFPKTNWNIFKFLWLPTLRCFGIMGIHIFDDIMILNGSGVGGGSLVYASTHIRPDRAVFQAAEWADLANWEAELGPHFETADRMLGTAPNPRLWPADEMLQEIATELEQEHTFKPTPVGIFFGDPGKTVPDPYFDGQGPARSGCIHCGGCMVGCRHNAKNTLDKNYLFLAEQLGCEIRPESNVIDIRPLPEGQADGARYEVSYKQSTAWIQRQSKTVRARNIVVAAGVLGTVELLLRCRDETRSLPALSPRLGECVRSNSEALMGITVRKGSDKRDFSQGVAITSHFWVDDVTSIEPVRYPRGSSLMRNLAWPLTRSAQTTWGRIWQATRYAIKRPGDILKTFVLPNWARDTTIMLIMQTVDSRMALRLGRRKWNLWRKGLTTDQDPENPIPTAIAAGRQVVETFADKAEAIPMTSINEVMLDMPSTAHILGGCGIGQDENSGVVNHEHEVFNYPGLYVADGSVIPANLGVNPSLTITAMAERAMAFIKPSPDKVVVQNKVPSST